MAIRIREIIGRLSSVPAASGMFERVQNFEPKSAPNNGLTCALFVQSISAVPAASGLDMTSIRLAITARIYKPFLAVPEDLIDPAIVEAVDVLMTAYSGDFEIGGEARNIDLLGAHGIPLQANAGYQTLDAITFRVMDIIIPVIINDAFAQVG